VTLWKHQGEPTLLGLGHRLVRAGRRSRMNVLLILETGGGGAGRHVIDLARGLIRQGYCVTLAYSALRAEASFLEEIHSIEELQCVRIDMTRDISAMDIQAARSIRAYVREFGPFQVIHGHSSKGGALSRIAAHGTEAARVYTPHAFVTLDPRLNRVERTVYSTAERALSHLTDAIICVSQEELDHALQLGVGRARLHLVHNGVDALTVAQRSDVRGRLGLEAGHLCIGYVGRLDAGKAVDRLVQAFADVHRQEPRTRLALVGTGSEEKALRSLCERLNVTDTVTFVGSADGRTMMAGFDVFALASLYEGFPYVLLEAARGGLPIVTTKVGGATQIVMDGATGFVVAQDDAANFTKCLLRVCRDGVLRAQMSAAAAEFVQPWTAKRMTDETIKVYSAAEALRQESAKTHGTFKRLLEARIARRFVARGMLRK
jgi:glycosyltransferase involved in cell wall biosynthesis